MEGHGEGAAEGKLGTNRSQGEEVLTGHWKNFGLALLESREDIRGL